MRIAMIGSRGLGSSYGGIERMLDELCPCLAERGHQVDVYGNDIAFWEGNADLRSIPTPALNGLHLETISRSMHATIMAARHCDLVHFHGVGSGSLAALTRLAGVKSAVTIHGLDHRREKWGRFAKACLNLAESTLVNRASGISVVSEDLQRYFRERHDIRTWYIPNGVPQKQPQPSGSFLASYGLDNRRYVLFASRLVPEKGCHDLISAFSAAPDDARLVIAGSYGTSGYVQMLRSLADPARVVFVGHRSGDELAELFSNAYLFVLPSYLEGMSMALLESIAFGIPAIVSDIVENRAVVDKAAFYFAPKNVPELSRLLAMLLSAPKLVAAMATRVAALKRPDWPAVAQQYELFYRAILASNGGALGIGRQSAVGR